MEIIKIKKWKHDEFSQQHPHANKIMKEKIKKDEKNSDEDWKKYKVSQLKSIARGYHLHVSGTKDILIRRIKEFLVSTKMAILIQRVCRGFFVRYSFKLRGNAFRNHKICVNETDFYTLEPLSEIPFELFYSFTDVNKFTYGFNINSLISLYNSKGYITNPYNRDKIRLIEIWNFFSLYKLVCILHENLIEDYIPVIPSYNALIHSKQYAPNYRFEDMQHFFDESGALIAQMDDVNEPIWITIQRHRENNNEIAGSDNHVQSVEAEAVATDVAITSHTNHGTIHSEENGLPRIRLPFGNEEHDEIPEVIVTTETEVETTISPVSPIRTIMRGEVSPFPIEVSSHSDHEKRRKGDSIK